MLKIAEVDRIDEEWLEAAIVNETGNLSGVRLFGEIATAGLEVSRNDPSAPSGNVLNFQ